MIVSVSFVSSGIVGRAVVPAIVPGALIISALFGCAVVLSIDFIAVNFYPVSDSGGLESSSRTSSKTSTALDSSIQLCGSACPQEVKDLSVIGRRNSWCKAAESAKYWSSACCTSAINAAASGMARSNEVLLGGGLGGSKILLLRRRVDMDQCGFKVGLVLSAFVFSFIDGTAFQKLCESRVSVGVTSLRSGQSGVGDGGESSSGLCSS